VKLSLAVSRQTPRLATHFAVHGALLLRCTQPTTITRHSVSPPRSPSAVLSRLNQVHFRFSTSLLNMSCFVSVTLFHYFVFYPGLQNFTIPHPCSLHFVFYRYHVSITYISVFLPHNILMILCFHFPSFLNR
jgi:hypothetical protein